MGIDATCARSAGSGGAPRSGLAGVEVGAVHLGGEVDPAVGGLWQLEGRAHPLVNSDEFWASGPVGLAARGPARPDLDRFIEKVQAVVDLSSTRRVGTRGGLIPVGGTVRPFATRDTVLVGDAAGLVSPLTAGGIHTALRSGRAAGLAIASHLLDGGPALDRALTPVYPTFRGKLPMRTIMDLRPPNALIDLALGSPRFRALAQAVFFHHRGLLSGDAWRDLGPALVSASRARAAR